MLKIRQISHPLHSESQFMEKEMKEAGENELTCTHRQQISRKRERLFRIAENEIGKSACWTFRSVCIHVTRKSRSEDHRQDEYAIHLNAYYSNSLNILVLKDRKKSFHCNHSNGLTGRFLFKNASNLLNMQLSTENVPHYSEWFSNFWLSVRIIFASIFPLKLNRAFHLSPNTQTYVNRWHARRSYWFAISRFIKRVLHANSIFSVFVQQLSQTCELSPLSMNNVHIVWNGKELICSKSMLGWLENSK